MAMGATDIVEQVNATVLRAGDGEGGEGRDVNWGGGANGRDGTWVFMHSLDVW